MSPRKDALRGLVTTWSLRALVLSAIAACSHSPPADFAPDAGLLAHMRDIEITVSPTSVCPGGLIQASYQAVIDDGTRVPFIRSYDKKHPPRLHVVFLSSYTSPEASSTQDGNWATAQNPVLSAVTGFQLTATLKAKPSITHTVVVAPDYSCMPHAFAFSGGGGGPMQEGGNGPDVTVRLGMGHSSFYDKLLVAGAEVGTTARFTCCTTPGRFLPPTG
jgi:hypothetical protein